MGIKGINCPHCHEYIPKEILDRLPTEEDINKFMDMNEE